MKEALPSNLIVHFNVFIVNILPAYTNPRSWSLLVGKSEQKPRNDVARFVYTGGINPIVSKYDNCPEDAWENWAADHQDCAL